MPRPARPRAARIRTSRALLLVPMLVAAFVLGGCKTGDLGSASSSGTTTVQTSADCPTSNTKSFAKTRFVANIGLIAGSFHRWIWKPYQAGTFKSGASGRTFALIKAAATAAFIVHELKQADENVNASPALCRHLKEPISELTNKVDAIAGKIRHGDVSDVVGANAILGTLTGALAKQGLPVTESTK